MNLAVALLSAGEVVIAVVLAVAWRKLTARAKWQAEAFDAMIARTAAAQANSQNVLLEHDIAIGPEGQKIKDLNERLVALETENKPLVPRQESDDPAATWQTQRRRAEQWELRSAS